MKRKGRWWIYVSFLYLLSLVFRLVEKVIENPINCYFCIRSWLLHPSGHLYCCSTQPSSTCTRVLNTDMANPSRLLTYYITILLSILFLRANAAPISFAGVEESWKRGLSEVYYHLTNPPPPISNLILPYTHQPNIQILNILHRNSKPSTHPHQQNIQHPLGSL